MHGGTQEPTLPSVEEVLWPISGVSDVSVEGESPRIVRVETLTESDMDLVMATLKLFFSSITLTQRTPTTLLIEEA